MWDTVIGDRTNGNYSTSSGPIIIKGKVIQGLGGGLCDQYREEKCFISAYDAQTGKLVWKFYTIAKDGEPGGDSWGKLSNLFRAGGDTWITGSFDPGSEPDLLGRRAGQALDARQPRGPATAAPHTPTRPWRSMSIPAS